MSIQNKNRRITITTSRLMLRELNTQDADDLYAIMGRPDVTEHYVDLIDHSTGWSREKVIQLTQSDPLGLWGIELDGRLVGWCAIDHLDWLPPVEPAVYFSIYLHPDCWGIGLATEAVMAIVRWALMELEVDSVLGIAAASNTRSLLLMSRLGASPEVTVPYRSPISGADANFVVHRFSADTPVQLKGLK